MRFILLYIILVLLCNPLYASAQSPVIHAVQIDWTLISHSIMGVLSNPIMAGLMIILVIDALLGGKKHVKKAAGKTKAKPKIVECVSASKPKPVPFTKPLRYTVYDGDIRSDRLYGQTDNTYKRRKRSIFRPRR